MITRLLLIALLAPLAPCGLSSATSQAAPAPPRPNIVVIMSDDQRWDTITAETMPYVHRRLQGTGVTFTNAFTTTGLCCPSRVSFLTGNLASRHRVVNNHGEDSVNGADLDTLATRLARAGYRCGLVGKYVNNYHLLGPPHRPAWHVPPGWSSWAALVQTENAYYEYDLVTGPEAVSHYGYADADYSTDVIAERARAFIGQSIADEQPFFAMVAPYGPHLGGDMAPTRYAGRFANIPPHRPPSYNELDVSDKKGPRQVPPLTDPAVLDQLRKDQLAALLAVDDLVRTVDAAVRPVARDTILVYTTDNGVFWGEHRLMEKNMPYDEAHRVPLIVVYPGKLGTSPRVESGLVTLQDVHATLAELAGVAPAGVDGMSFAHALVARRSPKRSVVTLEGWRPDRTLFYSGWRTMTSKEICWSTGACERYDLVADPYEMQSLPW